MKTCPVCGAGAFDDASTCYGCMHRYGEADPARIVEPTAEAMRPVPQPAPAASRTLQHEGPGWIVRFELPGQPQEGCELLRKGPGSSRDACDLLVRFQPALPDGSERVGAEGEPRAMRGNHARALEAGSADGALRDACVLTAMPTSASAPHREQARVR